MWKLKTAELTTEQFDDRDSIMEPYLSVVRGWSGGVCHFDGLDADTLQLLIDKGYADPEERQNIAPTIGEILEVMRAEPELRAHGYLVSRERGDARVSVEGVEGRCELDNALKFRLADEFTFDNGDFFCWFD